MLRIFKKNVDKRYLRGKFKIFKNSITIFQKIKCMKILGYYYTQL